MSNWLLVMVVSFQLRRRVSVRNLKPCANLTSPWSGHEGRLESVGAGILQDEGKIPRQLPCGHAARTTGKVSPRARQWIDLLLGVLGLS